MKLFCVIGIAVAATMLSDCGGSQSQLAPSGPLQSNAQPQLGRLSESVLNAHATGAAMTGIMVPHPNHGRPWMAPGAGTKDLLYISDGGDNDVLVYSYPQDKLVGTLTGFKIPDGVCPDKKGDVWIVNNEGADAVEYTHGGKKPIATVSDPAEYPISCSVDATTGNLAVTNGGVSSSNSTGSIAIYAHAKGNPTQYTVPKTNIAYFCGYDDKGNLFVDGAGPYGFQFAELPKGKKTITTIPLKGGTIIFPGNIRWDGKYVAVGDQEYKMVGSPPEYESAIYQTTGAEGKIVGTTVLESSHAVVGFWIEGKTVIGPDVSPYEYTTPHDVLFYNYPGGGKPTKTLQNGLVFPLGSAISQ